jgi:tetratricopeptide (TPR) repeat protein
MTARKYNFFLPFLAFVYSTCIAQPKQTFIQLVSDAEKETANKNWPSAIVLWEKVNEQNPVHHDYNYQLGNSYYQAGRYAKALEVFKKGFELSGRRSYYGAFNIAKTYAKSGDGKVSMTWVKKSFDLGMPNRNTFNHAAFDVLKSNPEFQKMAGTFDVSKLSRIEGWQYDLNFLAEEIRRKAFHVVRDFSKEDLEKEINRIDALLPKLTDMQITIEFMKLMVEVGDGHTMFYAMRDNAELKKCVPVEFYRFKEGLYIVQAEKEYKDLLGLKVTAIEGKSPDEFMDALKPILSSDNPQTLKGMAVLRMRHTAIVHAMGLAASPDELQLTVLDKAGQSKKIKLPGSNSIPSRKLWDGLPDNWVSLENQIPVRPFYLKDRYNYYWFQYLPDEKTVWFQYNRVLDNESKPYVKFLDSLFSFIANNEVQKLVIDLRNNNGGNGELSYPLIHRIVKSEKIDQWGRLFVIIGRKTFSAAGICITLLEKHTSAIFAGEPAATSPNFIGEEFEFELPYHHLWGNISDREHHYANAVDYRVWIQPTIYAEPSFGDFIKGNDAVWERILDSYPLK